MCSTQESTGGMTLFSQVLKLLQRLLDTRITSSGEQQNVTSGKNTKGSGRGEEQQTVCTSS